LELVIFVGFFITVTDVRGSETTYLHILSMADEAVDDFRSSLADLTFNSKPLINMLTMLAEENAQHAEQIVGVIEEHIKQVKELRRCSVPEFILVTV